jgi:membrane protein
LCRPLANSHSHVDDRRALRHLLPWIAATLLAVAAGELYLKTGKRSPLQLKSEKESGDVSTGFHLKPVGATRIAAPWKVLRDRWRNICVAVFKEFNDDRLMAVAGGVVFYGILALFPAITAFVSLYGLFTDPHIVNQHLSALQPIVPASAYQVIQQQVERAIEGGRTQLGVTSLVSLAIALWSANTGTKAGMDALNVVYDQQEQRSFLRLNARSLALTTGAMAVLMAAVAIVVVVPFLFAFGNLGQYSETFIAFARWPLLLLLVFLGLIAFYRFGPAGPFPGWRWLSVGAIFSLVGWMAASILLSWYLSNFGNYNAIYGSLGAVMGLMVWMWISTVIVLAGAEINAVLQRTANPTRLAE